MTTTRPIQRASVALLAASLALGLSLSACDRRAIEDDSAATPAEPAATGEAGVPPPVTDVDAPAATNTPEPPDPRDMTAGVPPAGSASAPGTTASQADALALLIAVDEHEIAAADQALMKQVTDPVLAYAQMMKTEHGKNLTDSTRLGGAASTAPAVTDLRKKGEADLKVLAAQDGAAYEKAYIDAMVRGHAEALALIDGTLLPAATADNVRQHFTATRATVAKHLARAKEIQATLK